MICECVERINGAIKDKNTEISIAFSLDDKMDLDGSILVATNKIDKSKKGKPIMAVASFCPFCGKNLGTRLGTRSEEILKDEAGF